MTQLWLVPVAEACFQTTLAEPVDLSDAPDKPATFPDRTRVWGLPTESSEDRWARYRLYRQLIESGDDLLIYREASGRYAAAGCVGPFWRTEYVHERYWPDWPATEVFAVEEYREVDIPRVTLNRILDYDLAFVPRGFSKVANERAIGRVLANVALERAQAGL